MFDVQVLVSRLVSKADRLIKNFTTNIAENWMQIRCKFDGGKCINRSQVALLSIGVLELGYGKT